MCRGHAPAPARTLHLLVDSTGLKLCGAGEWLHEKHSTKVRRSWRKLIRVSDEDMAALDIHCDPFHGEWNYTIKPRKPGDDAVSL